ncbi:dihydroxy-acid dehydratase domain-containing protein [Streptomyces thermodiastaticus]|jgi:dihydroxy-acid dehydratase|uniref:dihydroxy-acid dehydratase domain-containing protein n=1 Tax=Streptomyces thermodiastaticus TaxID=44061 RepID=UPI0016779E54|nr:dihydroxy-acid dehydratase [Streptomyces thermodiastaticus]MCE7548935.1 dihydroxy-acid dehydratase [Streptomyces thermodiastaticus]GHF75442.1 dihydroxy-acid dehydratase [Streptomyces thermodiastaticus]
MLRSNYQPGTVRWATRRAQWRALGLSDEDMLKPKIAVVNSSSDLAICFSHLDRVAARVKERIRAAGGLPFEVRTTAPSDFIHSAGHGGGYVLSARDLIVNDIEVGVEGAQLDGMICLASCDKTAPAQLMAAGRLNIPTLLLACGYQPSGQFRGEHCDIEDVFLHACGTPSDTLTGELTEMSEDAVRGPGVCAGMGTANSMHIVAEALGMALPGSTPVAADSPAMWREADRAAERIVAMVREDLRPRTIMTEAAFRNAARVALSVGASINTVKHLQAVAAETEVDIDITALYAQLGVGTPLLSAVRPNGPHTIEQFDAAGGARAVMAQLRDLLDLDALTATGTSVGDNLAGVAPADADVIRSGDRPFTRDPLILILRGSLTPLGGIVKLSVDGAGGERPETFTGPARCYDGQEDALDALAAGAIAAGDVVVVRGLGPRGRPGMGMASRIVFALDRAGLTGKVAVITDGQLSGLVNRGIVVGEVRPEAADAGPVALVRDGDVVHIDLPRRICDLRVPDDELERRRAGLPPAGEHGETGWLSVYRRTVRSLDEGAVLRPR